MAAMSQIHQDFIQWVDGLEHEELVALLKDLVDEGSIEVDTIVSLLSRNGVEGYNKKS